MVKSRESARHTGPRMTAEQFREAGHQLIDRIAGHLADIAEGPVRPVEPRSAIRDAVNRHRELPEQGADARGLLTTAAELLFAHSLFNGHPRFFGYITSSPAPIGMLGDLLATAVNPNCGAWNLAPIATEIEAQTVRWIAELIGFRGTAGPPSHSREPATAGLLVSGGNMANFVCFLAARTAKAGHDVRKTGVRAFPPLVVYASAETHTWIQKAADLFGHGTDAIRWIDVDGQQRMQPPELRRQIETDRQAGLRPFLVVGTAGTVGTGAVDPLEDIAAICREHDLWFHVDGAYGALAAAVPGAPADLRALTDADSVAVDPHKWLYAPLEAGCALVKRAALLRDAFSYHPPYYRLDEESINFVDYGPQNSRGFRALKVWLALQQIGRAGYLESIADDMRLSRRLFALMHAHPEFEALTQSLSIATFRYVPPALRLRLREPAVEERLNRFNEALLATIEASGKAFLSNAMVGGRFALRACIVNFHTSDEDIDALPELIAQFARSMQA